MVPHTTTPTISAQNKPLLYSWSSYHSVVTMIILSALLYRLCNKIIINACLYYVLSIISFISMRNTVTYFSSLSELCEITNPIYLDC